MFFNFNLLFWLLFGWPGAAQTFDPPVVNGRQR